MDHGTSDTLLHSLAEAAARVKACARTVPSGRWDDVIQTGDGARTRRQLLAHCAHSFAA